VPEVLSDRALDHSEENRQASRFWYLRANNDPPQSPVGAWCSG
jgi:hypothetical protein